MGSAQSVVGTLLARLALDVGSYKRGAREAKQETTELKTTIKQAMGQVDQAFVSSERRVASYVKQLAGDRLLRDANSLTAATLKLGGANKLLSSEKERVNAVLSRAIAQYKRLGQEAPEAMRRIARETRGATQASTGFLAGAARFATGFGMYDAVTRVSGALFRFATESVDAAGTLVDLRSKTGHSAEMLQRMEFVARQNGATLDNMTDSSFKLGVAIAGGGNSVKNAAKDLGLEFAKLQAMKPDELWLTVNRALLKVSDQQERNRLGVALMGRSYANIAASVDANFEQMAKSATVATDKQIEELDRLGDEWAAFVDSTQKRFTGFLGQAVIDFRAAADGWGKLFEDLRHKRDMALGRESHYAVNGKDVRLEADTSTDDKTKKTQTYAEQLKAAERAVRGLAQAERVELDAALKLGEESAEKLEERFFGGVAGALRLYSSLQKDAAKDTKDTAKEMDRLVSLSNELTGKSDLEAADRLVEALFRQGPVDVAAIPEDQLERIKSTTQKAIDIYRKTGAAIPPAVKQAFDLAASAIGSKLDTSELMRMPATADLAAIDLELVKAMARLYPDSVLDTSRLEKFFNEEAPGEIGRMIDFENEVRESLDKIEEMEAPRFPLMDWGNALEAVTQAIEMFGGDASTTFLSVARGAATLAQAIEQAYAVKGATFGQASAAQFRSGFGAAAIGAVAAAGAPRTGSGGQRVGQAFAQGAQAGAVAGPYGAAIVGGGFALGELVMNSAEIDARKAARTYLSGLALQFDQVATAAQKAEAAAETFRAKTQGGGSEEWNKGWVFVRDAYLATGQTAQRALHDFEAIKEAAKESPEAVARAVDQLNAILQRREELLDAQKQKQEMLNAAVERWGLSYEEAGRGFQRGQLAQNAERFIEDWRLLIESGANPETVASKMAESVNQFIADAKRAGAEVPEGMREIVETLIDMRLLTDESGRAFRNVGEAGIKWGKSLEVMFVRVLEKLEALIATLMRPLPDFSVRNTTPLSEYTGGQAHKRTAHTGAFVESDVAHRGLFASSRLLGSTERHLTVQVGEGIISAPITSRLGGRHGINAINAGRFDALATMAQGLPMVGRTLPDALPSLTAPSMALEGIAAAERFRSSVPVDGSGGGDERRGPGGDVYNVRVAPGAIVIPPSVTNPKAVVEEVFRQMPRRISNDDYGLRTTIRKQTKKKPR